MASGLSVMDYGSFREQAIKPVSERGTVLSRRGSKVVPRKYTLTTDELEKIRAQGQALGRNWLNPHGHGVYGALVDALGLLGVNEFHPYRLVRDKMRELMDREETINDTGLTAWQRFESD